jgi:hypothetical protein
MRSAHRVTRETPRARSTVKVAAASCALVVRLAWATASMASNLSLMKDTPYAHFTKQDHKIFKGALDAALNLAADGETRARSNPA